MRVLGFAIVLGLAVGGCGGLRTIAPQDRAVLSGTSAVRHVYFMPGRAGPVDRAVATGDAICSEPSPDTATQRALSVNASGEGGRLGADASAEAKLEYETSIVQLAGRTQTVLLARDFLFNVCLMRSNGYLTNDQAFALYGRTIDLVQDIATTDKVQSVANAARATAAPESIAAALAAPIDYGVERERLVTEAALVVLSKTAADRTTYVNTALNCAGRAGDLKAYCDLAVRNLSAAGTLIAMQTEIGRLSDADIRALHAAIGRAGQ